MAEYQIVTEATADLTGELMAGLPSVVIIPMQVEVAGQNYIYGPGGDMTAENFYALQREGAFATTSQIGPQTYIDFWEPILRSGKDILYLCFSSGLSGTIQSARIALAELAEQYPERKLICTDTLAASLGEGFLVREAAQRQADGFSIDALAQWVEDVRLNVCHWFTVDTFVHLRHGGRVSGAAAAIGTALQIKPLLHVDELGKLQVREKPRGRKQALSALANKINEGWEPALGKRVIIGHGDIPDVAQQLQETIWERLPDAEIQIADVGPIIGAHTGPGVLTLFYWGNNR